jgi:hypothetical protein
VAVAVGCLPEQSRPFARSGEGRVDAAIRWRQLRSTQRPGAPLVQRLFSAEDADSPCPFWRACGALTMPVRSLTLLMSSPGTSESVSFTARSATAAVRPLRSSYEPISPENQGPWFDLLVRARPARDPGAPSVVSRPREPKPASRTCADPFMNLAHTRAPFRPLSTRAGRQTQLRASFGLAPRIATASCDVPAIEAQDAFDQLLPPMRLTCTRTLRVPGTGPDFRRVGAPGFLGPRELDQGAPRFTPR